jgi:hypothetical protein
LSMTLSIISTSPLLRLSPIFVSHPSVSHSALVFLHETVARLNAANAPAFDIIWDV